MSRDDYGIRQQNHPSTAYMVGRMLGWLVLATLALALLIVLGSIGALILWSVGVL